MKHPATEETKTIALIRHCSDKKQCYYVELEDGASYYVRGTTLAVTTKRFEEVRNRSLIKRGIKTSGTRACIALNEIVDIREHNVSGRYQVIIDDDSSFLLTSEQVATLTA